METTNETVLRLDTRSWTFNQQTVETIEYLCVRKQKAPRFFRS